jgi:hypothetical protein
MENTVDPSAWAEEQSKGSGITTLELDEMITELRVLRDLYEQKKEASTKAYNDYAALEGKVVEAFQQAGKSKYVVEGLGTAYLINKLVVPTPKTVEQKKAFFKYLREKHGEVVFWDKVSVNHQTLQGIYNSDAAEALEAGDAMFSIPGIDKPTTQTSLGFRKGK